MTNIKKIVSVLFSAILLFSATTTSSIAIDKIHFVIGGGAGGGWDGTARGTGEALTKAGFLQSASFENMSGGGGAMDTLVASRLLVLFLWPHDWLEPAESTNDYGFSIVDF